MATTNTSFEHVLHNLHERDTIIDDMKAFADIIADNLRNTNSKELFANAFSSVYSSYDCYKQTINRFNIGIISFISDYYSIVDQRSDQFDSKYLHTYSDHRSHYSPILPETECSKFNIRELVEIFQEHCYDLKRFKFHTDLSKQRRARERAWVIYQKLSNYIASENVYDRSDLFVYQIESITNAIINIMDVESNKPSNKKTKKIKIKFEGALPDTIKKLKHLIQKFRNIKLDFKPSEELLDYCECDNVMQAMTGSSEMLCDGCGYIYELKGTVFDDSQFYSQDGIRYKHAGYEPSKHCRSWLERIQARETNTITEAQINKIEACIRRDGISNKKRITIEQLRRYLKDTGLSELNEHVALIKRLITGISPPQLSYSETQDITNSFSKAVKAYNLIRPTNKSNLLFYPFICAKLIEQHVSAYSKRKSLLSFIHLQGAQTLIQNDQIWMQICNVIPSFKYRPTDRYEYTD